MGPQKQTSIEPDIKPTKPETKKCNHTVIIVILAILTVGGFVFGGVELWQSIQKDDSLKVLQNTNEELLGKIENESEDIVLEDGNGEENLSTYGVAKITFSPDDNSTLFDVSKCKNNCPANRHYYYVSTDDGDDNVSGSIKIPYYLSDDKEYEIDFENTVAKASIGYFGNGSGPIPLFLMADGTMRYLDWVEKTQDWKIINLENVKDVVIAIEFGYADGYGQESIGNSGLTVLAFCADGTFYDLQEEINI